MHSLLALAFLIVTPKAHAAPGIISFSVGHQDQIQLNEIDTKRDLVGIGIISPSIDEHFTLKVQNTFEKTDISTRNLTGPSGQQTPLRNIDDGSRQILLAGIEYIQGDFLTSISSSQDIKRSVFSKRSQSLLVQWSPYSSATRLFANGETSKQDQPLSYFIDPDSLQSKPRLLEISNQNLTIGVEQILSEEFRTQISYTDARYFNYRPLRRKWASANSYAVNSRNTVRIDLGYSYENRSESLKDDRGFFDARWLETQWTYEWALNSLVGIGWSTVYENELDPRRNFQAQLGTDTLGIFLDKKYKVFSTILTAAVIKTSQGDNGLAANGDLKWEF